MALLSKIALIIGGEASDDTIQIPDKLGKGFIRAITINKHLNLLIRQYILKKAFTSNQHITEQDNKYVVIAFHNIHVDLISTNDHSINTPLKYLLPIAQITPINIHHEIFIPAHTQMSSVVITLEQDYLQDLLGIQSFNIFNHNGLCGKAPYLYEEIIPEEILNIAREVITAQPDMALRTLYLKIKVENLIYLLFSNLLERKECSQHSINRTDIKSLYKIRDQILNTLDTPPKINHLAQSASMSESKLNRLFKQVFGKSIYNYYQMIRMQEAAAMLQYGRNSVTSVAYTFGFSNLSHFTRLFEKHVGLKPKAYSKKK